MGNKLVAQNKTIDYYNIMKRFTAFLTRVYCTARGWVFARNGWKRFVEISKLPEMKISKTIGFIASILL